MNEGFISFKKKILRNHLIRFLIISFSLFLFIFGILLILTNTKVSSLSIIIDLLIGLTSAILVFLLGYFIFKPNDKKIAKRLDKKFDLKNRVQTMIELKDKDGIIVELQKEDTEEKLKEIPLKNLKFKAPFTLLFIFLIGLGTTICATTIKEKEPQVEPDDKEYTVTELQILKLRELQKQIKGSNIDEQLIIQFNAQIDDLISTLSEGIKESLLESKVRSVVNNIETINLAYANNKTIGKALNDITDSYYDDNIVSSLQTQTNKFVGSWKTKAENSNKFVITSTLIKIGDNTYAIDTASSTDEYISASLVEDNTKKIALTFDSSTKSLKFNNEEYYAYEAFTYLRAIGRNLYNYENNLSNLVTFLNQDYAETRSNSGVTYLKARLLKEIEAINGAINTSKLPSDNGYVLALKNYTESLNKINNEGTATMTSSLEKALNTLESEIEIVFNKEKNAYTECEYVSKTICEIFGLTYESSETNKLVDEDDSTINNSTSNNDKKDDSSLVPGGIGKGEKIYASYDKFFDMDSDGNPEVDKDNNNSLYAYGNFYADYKALYENLVISGYTDEEIETYLEVYFNNLVHGVK